MILKNIGGISFIVSSACQWSVKVENIDKVEFVPQYIGIDLLEITLCRGKTIYVAKENSEDFKKYKVNVSVDPQLYEWLFTNFCTRSTLF